MYNFEKPTLQGNTQGVQGLTASKLQGLKCQDPSFHSSITAPRALDSELRTQVKLGLHNCAFTSSRETGYVFSYNPPMLKSSKERAWPRFRLEKDWLRLGSMWQAAGRTCGVSSVYSEQRKEIFLASCLQSLRHKRGKTTSACRISSWQQLRWTPQGLAQSLFTAWRLGIVECLNSNKMGMK